jgi:hypothetical protein
VAVPRTPFAEILRLILRTVAETGANMTDLMVGIGAAVCR